MRRPSIEGRFQFSRWIEQGPKSPSPSGLATRDCHESGDGSVEVNAVDTGALWLAIDVEAVDDCKSLYNPLSFPSSLSVLVLDGLLTVLRLWTVCKGWQSLFSLRHLHCVSLMSYNH